MIISNIIIFFYKIFLTKKNTNDIIEYKYNKIINDLV